MALGDSAPELLGFFDNYDVKKEGSNKNNDKDTEGTSLTYDLVYHIITVTYTYWVVSAIALGTFVFGFIFIDMDLTEEGEKKEVKAEEVEEKKDD